MEELLEQYKRRLTTAELMIKKDDWVGNPYQARLIRLRTKASCYRVIITELSKLTNQH